MAEKRMITKKIVSDDNFISLSASAQALYLHLSLNADDDGFCNQVSISMFKAHASTSDLQALIEKRYIYQFDSGVIVIKHWKMANAIRKDRYTPTSFQDELAQLMVKDNGVYTWLPDGCQVVASCLPQYSVDKNSVDKNSIVCKEEPLYQLGTEEITHTQYDELKCRFSKDILDEVINRIVSHPYHGCLNVETIAKWCEESKNRPKATKSKKNGFHNYDQRDYSSEKMAELERMLINKG